MTFEARQSPRFSLMSLFIWWTVLILAFSAFGGLMLLVGNGLLLAILLLAVPLPLQYLLWGWWLGPKLRQLQADAEAVESLPVERR